MAGDFTEELTVRVTAEMEREIRACVGTGEYGSTSEAVRDALRLWKRKREEHAETLADIRARIRRSMQLNQGLLGSIILIMRITSHRSAAPFGVKRLLADRLFCAVHQAGQ